MIIVIELPFRLPGLNEYTRACRAHPVVGNNMKREAMQRIMSYLPPLRFNDGIEDMHITYVEPNGRRDNDNVCGFGIKVIQDALVQHGMIPDDSRKYIRTMPKQDVVVEKGVQKIIIEITAKERADD